MINFDSLAAVRISADIIATNYSSLWMYLGGGGGMESAYLKPLPITISGQSTYLYLPVFPITQRLYNIYYSLP